MSVFKTKGFIVKVQKVQDNDFLYHIFTFDYGIIRANKKVSKNSGRNTSKSKIIDVGYLIQFEISTNEKSDIHKIQNINIIKEFESINKNFEDMNQYLSLLSLIGKKIPFGVVHHEIYYCVEHFLKYTNQSSLKCLLTHLKIIDYIGELSTLHEDPTITRILKFIHQEKIGNITKLGGVEEEIQEKMKNIIYINMKN